MQEIKFTKTRVLIDGGSHIKIKQGHERDGKWGKVKMHKENIPEVCRPEQRSDNDPCNNGKHHDQYPVLYPFGPLAGQKNNGKQGLSQCHI